MTYNQKKQIKGSEVVKITVGTPEIKILGDTIEKVPRIKEFYQCEIDCNLHEKTLFQDIITLTVEYDISIHLEFTGEIINMYLGIRRLVGSTDQAYSNGFNFRIA